MRTSTVSAAAFLLLGAGAAAVSAAIDTTGNNLTLNGSDTLFDVTTDVILACPQANNNGIQYAGGGSGTASFTMGQNTQQLGPMSRTLKNTEYCGLNIPLSPSGTQAIQTTTQQLVIGLDGIGIFSAVSSACTSGVNNGASWAVTNNGDGVTAPGPSANGGPACPGCDAMTNNYTPASSLDVLRVLYGGFHKDGTYDCSSNVRKSLVKQWGALFSSSCANCAGGLTHAWRRSDLSGTTDAFNKLVGFGSRDIGTLPGVPNASKKTNPFCNGADAQGLNNTTTSNGGSTDFSDLDPIRQPCATNDQVCEANGTLGLVLPIFLPDNKVNKPTTTDIYPTIACGINKFDLIGTGNVHDKCPGGPSFIGQCFQPFALSGTTHVYECIEKSNGHAFGTPSGTDGRAWNLPLRVQGAATAGAYNLDLNGREMVASFFRIHTTLAATGSTQTCSNNDDTQQIGCLTVADPCSVGYAGRAGLTGASMPGLNEALSVNGIPPTDANIIDLITGAGPVYPIARRLYAASLVGFGHLIPGSGEEGLGKCFADNSVVRTAMANHDFVNLPAPGITCLSYDDAPMPGCGDTPAVTGCSDLPSGYITNPVSP